VEWTVCVIWRFGIEICNGREARWVCVIEEIRGVYIDWDRVLRD
jgi:hypothetical protein